MRLIETKGNMDIYYDKEAIIGCTGGGPTTACQSQQEVYVRVTSSHQEDRANVSCLFYSIKLTSR